MFFTVDAVLRAAFRDQGAHRGLGGAVGLGHRIETAFELVIRADPAHGPELRQGLATGAIGKVIGQHGERRTGIGVEIKHRCPPRAVPSPQPPPRNEIRGAVTAPLLRVKLPTAPHSVASCA